MKRDGKGKKREHKQKQLTKSRFARGSKHILNITTFFCYRLKEKKPGEITDDLRTALGMPVGPNAHKVPPPWLIAMQRYGPPPSYPNLKIPGLNAGIPEGCSFGYHAGGWGRLSYLVGWGRFYTSFYSVLIPD